MGHTVAMITNCVTKMITCSPIIKRFFNTMIVASSETSVIVTHHKNLLEKSHILKLQTYASWFLNAGFWPDKYHLIRM